ncbi:MAG: helix-turn-helix domain-containing protein [Promethearchaeota archaeon]
MQVKEKYKEQVCEVLDNVTREHATTFEDEYCFDSIVDEGSVRVAIKISSTIDNVEEKVRQELRKISPILRCTPLIVGERTRKRPLQDGIVHTRGNIAAINLETLRRLLEEDFTPFIIAKKGGVYVVIDGQKLKEARENHNLSRGDIAEEIGLSRRAIYEYERESMNPNIDVAMRLEKILGVHLIEPLSFIRIGDETTTVETVTGTPKSRSRLGQKAIKILTQLGLTSTIAQEAPFDIVTSLRRHVVLSCLIKHLSRLDEKRLLFLARLSDVLKEHPAIISSDRPDVETIGGIPIVSLKELVKIKNPKDFVALIKSRRGA